MVHAGKGNDTVFGERGNDQLNGEEGDDRLYGSVGDDFVAGGPGDDLLSGGNGSDNVLGNLGDDIVRGDTVGDERQYYQMFPAGLSGGPGNNTLSFASGVTPGFLPRDVEQDPSLWWPGFPPASGERGVFVDLEAGVGYSTVRAAENGGNKNGGGHDTIASDFQNIVGTPYADFLEGSNVANVIEGGGGPDVIIGWGGNDRLYGGGESDHIDGGIGDDVTDGGSGTSNTADSNYCASGTQAGQCGRTTAGVRSRATDRVAVGVVGGRPISSSPPSFEFADVYITGSDGPDNLSVSYNDSTNKLTVTSTGVLFDVSQSEGCVLNSTKLEAVCDLTSWQPAGHPDFEPLDVLHISGGKGIDTLSVLGAGLPSTTSVFLLGGLDGDTLEGSNETEDVIIDGSDNGNDTSSGYSRSDSIYQGLGRDTIDGGNDGDVIYSSEICENNTLDGGLGDDNITWAPVDLPLKSKTHGVFATLNNGNDGRAGHNLGSAASSPWCPPDPDPTKSNREDAFRDKLISVENLEGTGGQDVLKGGAGPNALLGRAGADKLYGGAGKDHLLTYSDDYDDVIDCGEGGEDQLFRDLDRRDHRDDLSIRCENPHEMEIPEYDLSQDKEVLGSKPEPFGLYRFGERDGTFAYVPDKLGKVAPSAYIGSVDKGKAGSVPLTEDTAVRLSDGSAKINLGDPENYDPWGHVSKGYSVEIWVKFWGPHPQKKSDEYQYIFSKFNGVRGIFLRRNSEDEVVFGSKYNSNPDYGTAKAMLPIKPSATGWHQIVGTLSGTRMTLYLDMVKNSSSLTNSRPSIFPNEVTPADVVVGPLPAWSASAPNGLPAIVDSLAMYGSALTDCQVRRHFALRQTTLEDMPVPECP